jgi:RNA polymerase sigma-70 factor, ECF subfamily
VNAAATMPSRSRGAKAGAPPPPGDDARLGGERDLLGRLRAGDDGAFEALVRANGGKMLAVARRYLRREEDARDAVQEAFVSAFRSIPRFQGGSSLSTWLHRITVNAALMKIRTSSRRPETPIEDLLPRFDSDGHHASPVEVWPDSAEEMVSRRETREMVRAAIEGLPESHRSVLLLRDIEDLDTEEVARILGVTPNAVKIRLHRARQALRALLSPIVVPPEHGDS